MTNQPIGDVAIGKPIAPEVTGSVRCNSRVPCLEELAEVDAKNFLPWIEEAVPGFHNSSLATPSFVSSST